MSDRATLANVLSTLLDASRRMAKVCHQLKMVELDSRDLAISQLGIWYCEGRLRGLLAEPATDAVDEGNAERASGSWD